MVATAFIVLGNVFLVAFGNHQSPGISTFFSTPYILQFFSIYVYIFTYVMSNLCFLIYWLTLSKTLAFLHCVLAPKLGSFMPDLFIYFGLELYETLWENVEVSPRV